MSKRPENRPVSFRPGTLQRDRLEQLISYRNQNQSTIINAAIDLLWLLDIGHDKINLMQQVDILTDNGQNDVEQGGIMINLNTASIDIRKAAWMKGVKSGKVDFHFDRDDSDRDATICKVYNRNFPDGIEITGNDLDAVRQYSFNEIKQLF